MPRLRQCGTDFNRDLIYITDILPPVIHRCKGSLTNNLACRSVSQRKHTFWFPGNREQQLMLAFGTTGEGAQPLIRFQTFDK